MREFSTQGVDHLGELLYKSVAEQIRQKIARQEWTTKLPTETELCVLFNVSRITLRHAIQELCNEGLVTKRQGLGMFIEKDDYSLSQLTVSRLFSNVSHYKTLQVIRDVRPYSYVSRLLNLSPGDTLVEAQRLCYHKDTPVSYSTVWIPEKLYADGFFEDIVGNGFIIPSLKHIGINIKRTAVTIEPLILKEKQPLIRVEKGEPILFLRRVGFDEQDKAIFIIEHILDGKQSRNILKIHTTH